MSKSKDELSFWGHLDELRAILIKIFSVSIIFAVITFLFKEEVFSAILAPREWDFITYRLMNYISNSVLGQNVALERFSVTLINTGLAGQFITHMKSSIYIGVLSVLPYILYQLFQFIAPALYDNERKVTFRVVSSSYVMFMLGVALTYFVLFPLTFRFLGTYQVSSDIENTITLQSYLGTFTMLSIAMGCVFEIPILSWLLARFGIINATHMRKFRRHVLIVILVLAAIITPTTDVFTLFLVSFPMYVLYEVSILIVRSRCKRIKR